MRAAAASREIARLVDPFDTSQALSDTWDAWLRWVLLGVSDFTVDEDLLRRAYQVSLLLPAANTDPSTQNAEWREYLDDVAGVIDIYSRLEPKSGAHRRLATMLYLGALQPTKARRVSRGLAHAYGRDSGERNLVLARVFETLTALTGESAVNESLEILRDQVLPSTVSGHLGAAESFLELQQLGIEESDPASLSWAVDLSYILAYRSTHDLRRRVGSLLPTSFIEACYSLPLRRTRAELLPPQRGALDQGALTAEVAVAATPTGSGKTFLSELRIAAELAANPEGLCVYVAPFNALATQVFRAFGQRLGKAGWHPTLWTGAYEVDSSVQDLGHILVTTPEKLDFIIRSRLEGDARGNDLKQRARCFIFDESHSIASGARGLRYELLMTRIKRLFPNAHVLAMSAVQDNAHEFGAWLAGSEQSHITVESTWHPTRIWEFLWKTDGSFQMRGESRESAHVPRPANPKKAAGQLAAFLLQRLPSVMLVETRKEWAESLAKELFTEHREALTFRRNQIERRNSSVRTRLDNLASEIRRHIHGRYPLADYVESGLAFHHAGLPPRIRARVEELAAEEMIHTLVATTTLAEGADLPFRAVILVHLNLPYGPIEARSLQNIRGRAGRPFWSNDGFFIVLQPENTNTATYQYFLDYYWAATIRLPRSLSGLRTLLESVSYLRAEADRVLESQLLAIYGEEQVELAEAPRIALRTYLAHLQGPNSPESRQIGRLIAAKTEQMMQPPSLATAASPVELTRLGRGVAISGLSAQSGRFLRDSLAAEVFTLGQLLEERGPAWLAIRLAWLPWEAVEMSNAYQREARDWRSQGFVRDVSNLRGFEDSRLDREYRLGDLLLQPHTYKEVTDFASESRLVSGRSFNDRLGSLLETAFRMSALLPWTLTGAIRVMESMGEEDVLLPIAAELGPYVRYLSHWIPWNLGATLLELDVAERDIIIEFVRASDLLGGSLQDAFAWIDSHESEARDLLGDEGVARLENQRKRISPS